MTRPRMRQWGIIALAVLVSLIVIPRAGAIEGYPGSTWGVVTYSTSTLNGSGGMGWINQGIDWVKLPGDIVLNTFVEYRYRSRSKQKEYYNAQGPAAGLEFKWSFLRLGTDYYWETLPDYPDRPKRSTAREVYLAGYYAWDLTEKAGLRIPGTIGLPGAIWFNLFHDTRGLTGSGGMGWINQGIDWVRLPGNIVLNTYAEYRYRSRSKLDTYYDARGPAVGLELRKGMFRLGADYYWQYAPLLDERMNYLEYYLTWYIDWDGKKN